MSPTPRSGPQPSIVLVGRRGSGLSSFAVIASRLLQFHLIDTEANLQRRYGMDHAACVKAWGARGYRDAAVAELEKALEEYHIGHVLLCGPEATETRSRALLQTFGRTHAVIMINRDVEAIQRYLRLDGVPEAQSILQQSQATFRSLSNTEFFNLPESEASETLAARIDRRLKHCGERASDQHRLNAVVQDFAHFLALLDQSPLRSDRALRPPEPELREFSTILGLPLQHVIDNGSCLARIDCACDAVELLIPLHSDADSISRALQKVRRLSSRPVIYHVQWEGEMSSANELEYMTTYRYGLRLLPEYITLDLHCTPAHTRVLADVGRGSKVIAHRRFTSIEPCPWREPDTFQHVQRAVDLGCVAARFVREAKTPLEDRDCVSFQAVASSKSTLPVCAINVGLHARSALISNESMTPIVQHSLAPGNIKELLLSHDELMRAKFSNYAYQPLHFRVLGASVDYSLSPAMHNAAFHFLGMYHTYDTQQTSRMGDLLSSVNEAFGGASITLPFKSEVLRLLDSMSDAARVIRAVNTVLPRRYGAKLDGSDALSKHHRNRAGTVLGLHGENTDEIALRTSIARHLSAANTIVSSTTALVVGAGGMAKAAIYALCQLGLERIFVWNRTTSKAIEVAQHFNESMPRSQVMPGPRVRVLESLDSPWPESVRQPSIVVCTPPVHTIGGNPGLDFEVPKPWFQSTTGGVIVEAGNPRIALARRQLLTL